MHDKTKTTTAGSLFRINYQYVNNKSQLRAGTIVIEAANSEEAWKKAEAMLPSYGLNHAKITNAKPY